MALAVVAAAALGAAIARATASAPERPTTRFTIDLPTVNHLQTPRRSVAISPDGRTIVYAASAPGMIDAPLWVRHLDSLHSRLLADARESRIAAYSPTFTADGQWILFGTFREIRKIPVTGGASQLVAPTGGFWGLALGPEGEIVVSSRGMLWTVGEQGKLLPLTTRDTSVRGVSHTRPEIIDSRHVAFRIQKDSSGSVALGIVALAGGDFTEVDLPGWEALGYERGHLLAANATGKIVALPFDLDARRAVGPPVTLVDSVVTGGLNGLQARLGADGSLVYLRGSAGRRLSLFDASNRRVADAPAGREYILGESSPDGRRVAVLIEGEPREGQTSVRPTLWIWEVESGALARLTDVPMRNYTWTPDGKRIAYVSGAPGNEIWSLPVDDRGSAELLARLPSSMRAWRVLFEPSGRAALLQTSDSVSGSTPDALHRIELTSTEPKLERLSGSRYAEGNPAISPDGRWLAYGSSESGRREVYVRELRTGARRTRISVAGGIVPRWGRDNRQLGYHQSGTEHTATLSFDGGTPRVVGRDSAVATGFRVAGSSRNGWTVEIGEPTDWQIVVVTNWLAEVRRKLEKR